MKSEKFATAIMEENKEKKMSLQEWSMHYRQIIILLVSCFVAMGIYGLANINKNEFPDFTIRQGIVVAVYPGDGGTGDETVGEIHLYL